jgi:hypothetical protein
MKCNPDPINPKKSIPMKSNQSKLWILKINWTNLAATRKE